MVCKSSPGLDVTHESKSLFLGVRQHTGCLTAPYRGLSNEVEESLSGDVLSNRQNFQVKRSDA